MKRVNFEWLFSGRCNLVVGFCKFMAGFVLKAPATAEEIEINFIVSVNVGSPF